MFLVTVGFSSVLIGFSRFTSDRVEANRRIAFETAVLQVLPTDLAPNADGIEINRTFREKVSQPESAHGAYVFEKQGQIAAYALPFEGRGFWAPIRGVIGIMPDKKSIRGIAFFEQNETPGLGAEITQPEFKNQFKPEKDKVLATDQKPLELVRPGTQLQKNQVYAVTGATQTSVRLEDLINEDVRQWQQAMGIREKNENSAQGQTQ